MDREEMRRLYPAYREKARDLIGPGDQRLMDPEFTISDHANVHVMEDGAFVEVVVWVPKELLT